MSQILGLKFRDAGQVYYFESGPFVVSSGDHVIVNTEQGFGLGEVVVLRSEPPEDAETGDIKPIYRLATPEDLEKKQENDDLARESFEFCRKCIRERGLDMKLVDVEVFFDRSKIIFYFTAPNRIDFRELVKDLVRTYRTRIELRQIGVRHETQMIGAVGNCGQVCCCRRFLRKFAPVTIKMAKEQNLFLNPTKISGICGRLLCCLSYEQRNYEEFHRHCPKVGKRYMTDSGLVKVLRANLFRSSLSVITDQGEEQEVSLEEWTGSNPRRPDPTMQPQREASAPREKPAPQGGDVPASGARKRGESTGGRFEKRADHGRRRPDREGGKSGFRSAAKPEEPIATVTEASVEATHKDESGGTQGKSTDSGQIKATDKPDRSAPKRGRSQKSRPRKTAAKDAEAAPQPDKPERKSGKTRRKRKRKPKTKSSS
jgi:cell fate regulator YaaT (PSP1 superfamily)